MDDGDGPSSLGAFPYRRVRVTCVWCPRRRGDYCVERLIARHGAGVSLDEVLRRITATCRYPKPWGRRGPNKYHPWCRAQFSDLGTGKPPNRKR
ncbi:hypothetical protein OCOJLMKI_4666 [Methylobacterium iners]|uniref:Uncharacterized protein n=1 Tax=Methylobacterium iners TaxID=418707 RepID=A0ABQ4S495_9HYPH|nr:hypothetical protein OCOJLMKI_4666 [Methylobacterium iners]